MTIPEWAIGLIGGLLIAAGRELATLRQARKDLNGLGAKSGKLADQDVRIIVSILVVTDKREDREMIARPLLDR